MSSDCFCFPCISTNSVGVVETFGKYTGTLGAGLNCIACPCSVVAGVVSLRVQQLFVYTETKTKDDVTVKVNVAVQYRVMADKVYDAFYRLTNPQSQIKSYVDDVVRTTIPKMDLDAAFENKDQVAQDVKESLDHSMSQFGFEIVAALVVDLNPDVKVKEAMNEINAARRDRMAAQEKAEAGKIQMVKNAEGESEAKYLSGVGVARQRTAIVDGLKESVLQFSGNVNGTTPTDVINMMMTVQYMDMLKDVGGPGKKNTIFLNHSPGAVTDLQTDVRDGFVLANKAAKMNR